MVLIVLAILSIIGGLVGIPESLGGSNAIEHWLAPLFQPAEDALAAHGHGAASVEYLLMVLSVGLAAAGIVLAWRWYTSGSPVPRRLSERLAGLYRILLNKWYVDEIYEASIVTPTVKGSEKLLWKWIDVGVIDWCANGMARAVGLFSGVFRKVQTGVAQSYVFVFILGVVALLGWILGK
jgi:NADH-quinone oxidoreductase subunit L